MKNVNWSELALVHRTQIIILETIEHPPNLSWEYVNVLDEMDKYYNVPVATTNDANAAALGEMFFGIAQGMRDFIVITLGTGLGMV